MTSNSVKIRKILLEDFNNLHKGPIYKEFLAYFTYSLFNQMHKAYVSKSRGRPDQWGDTWTPLSPVTIDRKRRRNKRRVARSANLIMIDSRDAIRSYKPGSVSANKYAPPPNQIARISRSSITYGSTIPYLKYHKRKVVMSRDATRSMIRTAIKYATRRIKPALERKLK